MSKVEFLAAMALMGLVAVLTGFYLMQGKEDKASDVMRSCADTGMYLHKGYAISCRVLVDGSHDSNEVKL